MKHTKHEHRKSFAKWGMPGQRFETLDSQKLNDRRALAIISGRKIHNIGKNNGPLKHSVPARNLSTQFTLHKHSIVKDPCGPKAKVIPAHEYCPR